MNEDLPEESEGWQVDEESSGAHKDLPDHVAAGLEWKTHRVVPDAFTALVQTKRPLLFEIACSPDSVLTKTVQDTTGDVESARRLSYFSGFDLSSGSGVRQVLQEICRWKPVHVWLSLECGPFSRMQHLNRRAEQQRRDLEAKRTAVLKQYVGGLVVYSECHRLGISATWEWSETCEAWRLPMVQKLFAKIQPWMSVVKGCAVGLESGRQEPVGKGWGLAATHELLASRVSLPCMCEVGVKHAVCEGSLTRESAYYTPKFAERVTQALLQGCTHEQAMLCLSVSPYASSRERLGPEEGKENREEQECECDVVCHPRCETCCAMCERAKAEQDPLCLGTDLAAIPLTPQEKDRALRQIGLIHRATGHGPITQVVHALERRGADPRILELAKGYECPACVEARPRLPKQQASLEPLPPKWSVVQADNAQWTHPSTGVKYQFMLMIDEGCRFRVARLLQDNGSGGVKSEQMIKIYQEIWKPIFGHPARLRVDPEGAWRARALEEFFSGQHVELVRIPAEAHWQISHVERAIQCTKAIMNKVVAEDPSVTATEALSEAIRTSNEKEIARGYSPAQHALGRAPDEYGRFHAVGPDIVPEVLGELPEGEFRRNWERMQVAGKAFIDWTYSQRMIRAQNSRGRNERVYQFIYRGTWFTTGDSRNEGNLQSRMGRSMVQLGSWLPRLVNHLMELPDLEVWCG